MRSSVRVRGWLPLSGLWVLLACAGCSAIGGADGGAGGSGGGSAGSAGGSGGNAGGQAQPVDAGPPPRACRPNTTFNGQVGTDATRPWLPWGGVLSTDDWPQAHDAGLAAVLAAVPAADTTAAVSLAVTAATVVATTFNTEQTPTDQNRLFVVSDGHAQMMLFLDPAERPPFEVRVGQRLSFRATEVARFRSLPQITAASDWQLVDGGNTVYVADRSLGDVGAADVNRLVRVTGLTSGKRPCGANVFCYEVTFGALEDRRIGLRTNDSRLDDGACATFVGPVGSFDGTLQLSVTNWDWLSTLCSPECTGRQCGGNGCGGACGHCGAFQTCSPAGACQACAPQCSGRSCGADGCGGTCGQCAAAAQCQADGTCAPAAQGPMTMCPFTGLDAWAVLEEGIGPAVAELSFFAGGALEQVGATACQPIANTTPPGSASCMQTYQCGACALVLERRDGDAGAPRWNLKPRTLNDPACTEANGFYALRPKPTGPWMTSSCAALGGTPAPSGACVVTCYHESECPEPGMRCGQGYQHYCGVRSCVIDPECGPAGWDCHGGLCYLPCTTDTGGSQSAECPAGWRCTEDAVNAGRHFCVRLTDLGAQRRCSDCLDACRNLPGCCQGTGCICDAACP